MMYRPAGEKTQSVSEMKFSSPPKVASGAANFLISQTFMVPSKDREAIVWPSGPIETPVISFPGVCALRHVLCGRDFVPLIVQTCKVPSSVPAQITNATSAH